MINKLSQKQEAKIPEYLNYWLAQGRRVQTIDRERAKESINFLYTKILKIGKPKQYLFLDSPMACQSFLNGSSQLRNQLESQLWNQLWNQLENQLGSQLGNLKYVSESKTNWAQAYYWHCSYILNELLPEKKKDFGLFLDYLEHSKHYHYVYLSQEVAVFSDFPKTINLDSAGRLDSSESKALEYRDGCGFYARKGIVANSKLELELL